MRVLITGGRGFAGRHTIDHLLATTDWEIVSVDSRFGNVFRQERLTRLAWDLRFPFDRDIDEKIGHVDSVIHLAASADVHAFLESPREHVLNNVHSMISLLEWAQTRQLQHFILASTNEVYGPTEERNGERVWAAIAPPTPYSGSKASQEALAISWWRSFRVPVVITNTMQLFGVGQPEERFIPTVVNRLLRGQTVQCYGQQRRGFWQSASRCWTYVINHADALRFLLTQPASLWPEQRPDRWNIAGPEITCEQMIFYIADLLNVDVNNIKYVESDLARPGHEARYALDTSKITQTGWEPPVEFKDALSSTVFGLATKARLT